MGTQNLVNRPLRRAGNEERCLHRGTGPGEPGPGAMLRQRGTLATKQSQNTSEVDIGGARRHWLINPPAW